MEFACSLVHVWVLSGYSSVLPPSENMHIRFSGDSKLTLGGSVYGLVYCKRHLSLTIDPLHSFINKSIDSLSRPIGRISSLIDCRNKASRKISKNS